MAGKHAVSNLLISTVFIAFVLEILLAYRSLCPKFFCEVVLFSNVHLPTVTQIGSLKDTRRQGRASNHSVKNARLL